MVGRLGDETAGMKARCAGRALWRGAALWLVAHLLCGFVGQATALPDGAIARLGHGMPNAVQYSPDGELLAVATSIGVGLWDAVTHERVEFYETDVSMTSVAFSPSGTVLASGGQDNNVKLWDINAQGELATLRGHNGWVTAVAFSPDGGTLATAS